MRGDGACVWLGAAVVVLAPRQAASRQAGCACRAERNDCRLAGFECAPRHHAAICGCTVGCPERRHLVRVVRRLARDVARVRALADDEPCRAPAARAGSCSAHGAGKFAAAAGRRVCLHRRELAAPVLLSTCQAPADLEPAGCKLRAVCAVRLCLPRRVAGCRAGAIGVVPLAARADSASQIAGPVGAAVGVGRALLAALAHQQVLQEALPLLGDDL